MACRRWTEWPPGTTEGPSCALAVHSLAGARAVQSLWLQWQRYSLNSKAQAGAAAGGHVWTHSPWAALPLASAFREQPSPHPLHPGPSHPWPGTAPELMAARPSQWLVLVQRAVGCSLPGPILGSSRPRAARLGKAFPSSTVATRLLPNNRLPARCRATRGLCAHQQGTGQPGAAGSSRGRGGCCAGMWYRTCFQNHVFAFWGLPAAQSPGQQMAPCFRLRN